MAEAGDGMLSRDHCNPVSVAVARRRSSPPALEAEVSQALTANSIDVGDCISSDDVNSAQRGGSTRCGYGRWRPNFLQVLNSPKVLVLFLAAYSFVLGFQVNGIHNVNVSTIERRFSLSSTSLGFVTSSFDISAASLALIIGYYGSGRRKPRLIAGAMLFSATGSFLMASPHFLTGSYSLGTATDELICRAGVVDDGLLSVAASSSFVAARSSILGSNQTGGGFDVNRTSYEASGMFQELEPSTCSENGIGREKAEADKNLSKFFFVFLLAQLLHGVGGTTLFTVGTSLVDDSVDARQTPMMLGVIYGANLLGSGSGYILGGRLLQVYVDFDVLGWGAENWPEGLSPEDSRWVGAWWVGPTIAATLQLILCLPLSLYGAELPQARQVRRNRQSQAHSGSYQDNAISSISTPTSSKDPAAPSASSPEKPRKLRRVLMMTREIVLNPCFSFITLVMTTETMFMSGCAAFLPKIIENEFGISPSQAAVFSGAAVIPAACFGLIFGGWVAKHYSFTIRTSIKFIMVFCFLGGILCSVMWVRCKPPPIYGVDVPYEGVSSDDSVSLWSSCNGHCLCQTNIYEPVCSQHGGVFFSPCHAGCTNKVGNEYTDCSCVPLNYTTESNASIWSATGGSLSSEHCSESCALLWAFVPLLFLVMCASFMPVAPCDSLQLRCVTEEQKVYAQGIKTLVWRLLGSFVGPIMMGRLVDQSCHIWREECGNRLSCWIYDHDGLILSVYLYVTSLKLLSFIFASLALRFYRPPKPSPAGTASSSAPPPVSYHPSLTSGGDDVTVAATACTPMVGSQPEDDGQERQSSVL